MLLTGRIGVEEGHACLQQIGEHGAMEIAARAHADFHVEEATDQRGNSAGDDAECVYVYGIRSTEQTVRVQREDRPKETVVEHVREFFDLASVFDTPDILQIGPV